MSKYVEVEKLECLADVRDESSVNSVEIAHVRCPHQTRARWKPFTPYSSECSNCGEIVRNERLWKKMYCPKCGARMDT